MMDSIAEAITGFLRRNNNPLGLLLLGSSAMLEYLFPPFPGDTVLLFGAFLVTRYGWSMPLVFLSVLLGSAVGAMTHYYLGAWLRPRYEAGRFFRAPKLRLQVERVLRAFRRHGAAYVALNRFLPALRAVFFIAAGMAGLRPAVVLLFATVSASAWNALVIGVGYAVGANWERIQDVFRIYSKAVWSAIGLVVLLLVARRALQLRRGRREAGEGEGDGARPGSEAVNGADEEAGGR